VHKSGALIVQEGRKLCNAWDGRRASDAEATDLLNQKKTCDEAYGTQVLSFLDGTNKSTKLTRINILTMGTRVKRLAIQKTAAEHAKLNELTLCRRALDWGMETGKTVDYGMFSGLCSALPLALFDAVNSARRGSKAPFRNYLIETKYPCTSINPPSSNCVIIDRMFAVLGCYPNATMNTYGDWADLVIMSWIIPYLRMNATSAVHLVFDDPRHEDGRKKFCQAKRDGIHHKAAQGREAGSVVGPIAALTPLAFKDKLWKMQLGNRETKRKKVRFLCETIGARIQTYLGAGQQFVMAGGFEGEHNNMACVVTAQGVQMSDIYRNDHPEADTKVFIHASKCGFQRVSIYSPDSDIVFIALLLYAQLKLDIHVQICKQNMTKHATYVEIKTLWEKVTRDNNMQHIASPQMRVRTLVMMFLASGSDYTSFFYEQPKKTFLDMLCKNARFVCPDDDACIGNTVNIENAMDSFFRLVGTCYFNGNKKLFGLLCADQLFAQASAGLDDDKKMSKFIDTIRMQTWVARAEERKRIPTIGALRFHFLRSVAAMEVWEHALAPILSRPALDQRGYIIGESGELSIRHDTEENERNVRVATKYLTDGCGCGGHCKTKACPCKKQGRACGPACRCTNCCNCADCIVAPLSRGTGTGGEGEVGAEGEEGEAEEGEEHFCGVCEQSMGGDIGNLTLIDDVLLLCESCEAEQDAVELDDDDEIRSEDDASDEDVHCDAEIDETNGEDGSGSDVDPDD